MKKTISYGTSYFGPDNNDCMCHTCEIERRLIKSTVTFLRFLAGSENYYLHFQKKNQKIKFINNLNISMNTHLEHDATRRSHTLFIVIV